MLFPSRAARLQQLHATDGQIVRKGDVIAVLQSDELEHKKEQALRRIRLLRARLARVAGDSRELSQRAVLLSELEAALQDRNGLKSELMRLNITAPMSGIIRDLNPELHAGRYLDPTKPLARLVSNPARNARGYIREEELWRLDTGAQGWFIPDDPALAAQAVTVKEVSQSGSSEISIKYLASVYGGLIASETRPGGVMRPRAGVHYVRFSLKGAPSNRIIRGVIHLQGHPESIAAAAWRRVLKVLVRESGM